MPSVTQCQLQHSHVFMLLNSKLTVKTMTKCEMSRLQATAPTTGRGLRAERMMTPAVTISSLKRAKNQSPGRQQQ